MLYVVPDCGLKIEIKDAKRAHLYDHNKPVQYSISDTRYFAFRDQANYSRSYPFQGVMSPSHELTLPSEVRKLAGIPATAERFAYMHPPTQLASLIDWKKQKNYEVGEGESCADHPRSRAGKEKDQTGGTKGASKQTGRAHAILLGAFVYFGKSMEILSVNALSLEPSNYDIKLTGPWAMTPTAINAMQELGRLQKIEIDIFNEGGLIGLCWVSPGELFQSEPISIKGSCPNGAFVYLREDGSGICYHIQESDGIYFPQEDVEILVDCVQGLGLALESGILTFNTDVTGNFPDAAGWKISALAFADSEEKTKYRSVRDLKAELRDRSVDDSLIIHKACQVGLDKEYVQHLIHEVGDIFLRTTDRQGWMPLHYACRFSSENIELIKYLLGKYNEAVEKPDRFGRLPLHLACDGNAPVEVIRALLENHEGTVLGETNYMKMIPLHIACNREAEFEVVKVLLDADTQELSVTKESLIGRLPLHMAIEEKMEPDVVDLLLEKGNDDDIYTPFGGLLPLHLACLNGSKSKTVQILLDKDVLNTTKNAAVEGRNKNSSTSDKKSFLSLTTIGIDGMIPLHLALRNTSADPKTRNRVTETIRLLLMKEKKSEQVSGLESSTVYFRNEHTLKSPLHLACENNARYDIIRLLLDLDPANQVIHFKDQRGMKPIHYACNKVDADPKVVEMLLVQEKEGLSKESGSTTTTKPSKSKKLSPRKDKHQKLSHSLDYRERSPLLTAVRTGATSSVIEILIRPKYLYLKGFDDHSVHLLGEKVNLSEEMKRHIVTILSDRSFFTILFLELYAHIVAIYAFIQGSERLLNGTLTNLEPAVLSVCIGMFIIFEAAQMKSQGWNYFKDIWNAPELLSLFCLTASVIHMRAFFKNESDEFEINRDLMIATGILLIVTFIFFCRSTFLPFARFVGGLLLILTTLVPFFTISSLLLLAFTYSFRISGNHDDACTTLSRCYLWTLQGFFSGSDDTKSILDILFGIVAIIILLNVVVAIVGDAWEQATDEASSMYWSFRVSYLLESRAFAIIQKKVMKRGFVTRISEKIDEVQGIVFNGNVTWSKGVYSQVSTKAQYERPELYFHSETAFKVKNARSLKSDLHWAKIESKERVNKQKIIQEKIERGEILTGEEKWTKALVSNGVILRNIALFRFIYRATLYLFLIVLGIPFGGWFWPVGFRQGVLSLGIDTDRERTADKVDGDIDEKLALLSDSDPRGIDRGEEHVQDDSTASASEGTEGVHRSIPFVGTVSSLSVHVPVPYDDDDDDNGRAVC